MVAWRGFGLDMRKYFGNRSWEMGVWMGIVEVQGPEREAAGYVTKLRPGTARFLPSNIRSTCAPGDSGK